MLLRPGVAGNAALIGCSENDLANYSISYPAEILNTKQGAISFWVAPGVLKRGFPADFKKLQFCNSCRVTHIYLELDACKNTNKHDEYSSGI
jgi:hypothetical protein